MTQLVFVHGVATRSSPDYTVESANRDLLFRKALFQDDNLVIHAPMWGDRVPPLAWTGKSFPRQDDTVAALSLFGGLGAMPAQGDGAPLVLGGGSAESNLASLDALLGAVVDRAEAQGRPLNPGELAQFTAAVDLMADSNFTPQLGPVESNDAFVDAFHTAVGLPGSFGLLDDLKTAAGDVADKVRNLAGTGLVALFRDGLNPAVARFLGDVFIYLKPGAIRDEIRALIVQDVSIAFDAARRNGEKLVLMGHSLGGVILYDLLSSPASAGLPKDFAADAFITVGSQSGLFEELGLFDFKGADYAPPQPMKGPGNVGPWINIYDPIDLFGFRAAPVFSTSEDFRFDSVTGLVSSHTTYFKRPQFHARLRKRLIEAKVTGDRP